MTSRDLAYFKEWFASYCKTYYSANPEDQQNIVLKEVHTHKVCENMSALSVDLALSENETLLAETIALFHDIGRFPQYARYKTFRDGISVNHGVLGVEVLSKEGVLAVLSERERALIATSITFHNAFRVPKGMDEDALLFVWLIRDADKLDIWRVFIEYYESPENDRASAVGLGLPNIPQYSKEIVARVMRGEIVALSEVKTLNDFKLLQLSWIFDLNYPPSFRLLSERNYIERILATLPSSVEIECLRQFLNDQVRKKMESGTVEEG